MGLMREIPAPMLAAIKRRVFFPVSLVYLDWPGGVVRAHSGRGDLVTLGGTWRGVGKFGAIDVPAESAGLVAVRATLTLMGVPSGVFDMLGAPIRNRPGQVYFGVTTEPGGNVLVSDPISMFAGRMDAMRYTLQPDGGDLVHAVQIELGSGPSARARASVYHSAEDQKRKFPSDTAGRLLKNIAKYVETMTWPE